VNWLNNSAILGTAFVAVFLETAGTGVRRFTGAQIDLLPALLVYAAFTAGVGVITATALVGGLCFDALSANPLGITVVPLLATGLILQANQRLVLRNLFVTRCVMGLFAGALVPLLSVLCLWLAGAEPLLGWASLWHWVVLAVSSAMLTPPLCGLLERFQHAFSHPPLLSGPSFRPDREIKRGRIC